MTRRRATRVLRTVGPSLAGLEHALDCECDGCTARYARRTRGRAKPAPGARYIPDAGLPLLGTIGDRALAAQLGVTARAVAAERERWGISAAKPGPRPRAGVKADVCRTIKFTEAEAAAQDTAAGDRKYASWAHDRLVEAAAAALRAMKIVPSNLDGV